MSTDFAVALLGDLQGVANPQPIVTANVSGARTLSFINGAIRTSYTDQLSGAAQYTISSTGASPGQIIRLKVQGPYTYTFTNAYNADGSLQITPQCTTNEYDLIQITLENDGSFTINGEAFGVGPAQAPTSAPALEQAPTLNDPNPTVGDTITVNEGIYSGNPVVTSQWYYNDTSPPTLIPGANSAVYVTQIADGLRPLLYEESATNKGGTIMTPLTTAAVQLLPLVIIGTPSALVVGTYSAFAPTVSGGKPPYIFTLPGKLPSGMVLNQSVGYSGQPTMVTAPASYTMTVTDAVGNTASLGPFSLGVVAGKPSMPSLRLEALNGVIKVYGTAGPLNGGVFQNFKLYQGTSSGGETLLVSPTSAAALAPYLYTASNGVTNYFFLSVVTDQGEGTPSPEAWAAASTTFTTTTDFAVNSNYAPILAALSSAGPTPSGPLQYVQNDLVNRLVNSGAWANMGWFTDAYFAGNEAQMMIDWTTPSRSLTKVGSPTFTPLSAATSAQPAGIHGGGSTANAYQTSLTLASFAQNSAHIAVYSSSAGALQLVEAGAQDTSSNGIEILCLNGVSTPVPSGRVMGAIVSGSTATLRSDDTGETITGYYNGGGHTLFNRTNSAGFDVYSRGRSIETITSPSVALTSTNKISLLAASGGTTATTRTLPNFHCGAGLTTLQAQTLGVAITDYINTNSYGIPRCIDAGVGPASMYAEVVVLGTTASALCAAYQAKRRGRSVLVVGMEGESKLWRLGGMLAQGLGYADIADPTLPAGIWRDMTKWINTVYYVRADASTQAGFDIDAKAWNAAFRRLLDPTQTGALIPGMDIPVVWSGAGVQSISKPGQKITSVTMGDGRTINCQEIISADYLGVPLPIAGIPTITGREAASTNPSSVEHYNGYQLPNIAPAVTLPSAQKFYLSPMASGNLLPDIVNPPSLAVGAADPVLQSMNFRLQLQVTQSSRVPWPTTAPRNYNVQRYEMLMRLAGANGNYIALADELGNGSYVLGIGALGDYNSGVTGMSTDMPQSGLRLGQAANASARAAVINDLYDYTMGLIYKIVVNAEADARNGAILSTNLFTRGLNASQFTNPEPGGFTWWPDQAYVREPIFQMKNAGFVLNGDDVTMADGTTPRSIKTVAAGSYPIDIHVGRHCAYDAGDGNGVCLYFQGAPPSPPLGVVAGGSDRRFPIPLEAIVPDASVCINLITPTCLSVTKLAWAPIRVEPTLCVLGQSSGMIAALAIEQNCAVQNISYSSFQIAMGLEVDTYKVPLPQKN